MTRPEGTGASVRHAVVVLNWHGAADTVACVASLVSTAPEVEVVVVDNGSFDGALREVSARWPAVHTVQLPRNVGFTGGMNAGIRHAISTVRADVVTVLNNDTVVQPGAMAAMRAVAATGAAVCPEIRYRDAPDTIWYGGGTLDARDGYPHHTRPTDLPACRGGVRDTQLLTGCCITATVATWRRVGLFDERFFLNFEDSEWSLRARRAGVRLVVACDAVVLHAVSASFRGPAAALGSYYFLRNGLLFSRLAGAGTAARKRFLRRFALGGLRRATTRTRVRRMLLAAAAVISYLAGCYGEAPAAVARTVARWQRPA